jgi:hypothetical protein
MKAPNWRERLATRLTVGRVLSASLFLLVLSVGISSREWRNWTSDVVLNLALLGFGLVVAYLIGEHWLEQYQQQRWQPVDQVLQHRVLLVTLEVLGGLASAPTIRQAMKLDWTDPAAPHNRPMFDPAVALTFSENHLTPAIVGLPEISRDYTGFMGLTGHDWNAVIQGVNRSQVRLAQTTILLHERLSPSLQAALLHLEDRTTAFVLFRLPWAEQRSGQGELAYQEASLAHAKAVVQAANGVLRELIEFRKHGTS